MVKETPDEIINRVAAFRRLTHGIEPPGSEN